MDNLNVGDVVQLNSGGPDMTVKEIGGKLVTCTWFDTLDKLNEDKFLSATLKKSKSKSTEPWSEPVNQNLLNPGRGL